MVFLFAQLSIAAYACPALTISGEQVQTVPATSIHEAALGDDVAGNAVLPLANGVVGCDQMAAQPDKASPERCAGHCHNGQQVDQGSTLPVPVLALISLYIVAPMMDEACHSMSAMAASVDAPVAASRPHSILHCSLLV